MKTYKKKIPKPYKQPLTEPAYDTSDWPKVKKKIVDKAKLPKPVP